MLRGTRLLIPTILRRRVLDLAHEGHQGVVKPDKAEATNEGLAGWN